VASENYIISRIKIAEIEPAPKGTPRVKLTFYVYTNGVYEIGICRKEGDTEQKMSIIPSSGLSQDEVALIQQKITKMAEACIPQELQASDLGILLMPAIE
jgi:molecular chaperone DnaK